MIEKTLQMLKDKVRPILPELVDELNPSATPAQIDEIAAQLPFDFPDELRQLYSVHNGEANERGLFFGLPLSPLSLAFDSWQGVSKHASEDFSDIDKTIVSVPPKHTKKNYINAHYFPFSHDGAGNHIVIDLDPDQEGVKGQIINYGTDENTRYVIAPSLDDFLAFCIHQIEIGNYIVKEPIDEKVLYLKEPDNEHLFDTLSQLKLPFRASERKN